MNNHTPTPWNRNINAKYPIYDDKHNKIAYYLYGKHDQPTLEKANENLKLIVKAVNCHDELVKTLEALLNATMYRDHPAESELAKQALIKAGAL